MAIERLVLDSSAVVSIALTEPDYEELKDRAVQAHETVFPAPLALETAVVLAGRSTEDGRMMIARILADLKAEIVAFSEEDYRIAYEAYMRFGKGRHPAALNILDCMAYAAAISLDAHLLFTGTDFQKTDVRVA